MTRKKRARTTFADTVARLKAEPAARAPWPRVTGPPSQTGHLRFDGTHWHRVRTNVDLGATRELFLSAHLVVLAQGGDLSRVADADRERTWALIRDRFDGPGGRVIGPGWPDEPVYTADQYADDDGRVLLYVETHC